MGRCGAGIWELSGSHPRQRGGQGARGSAGKGPRGLRTGDEGQRPWRHHRLSEGGAEWYGPGQTEGRSLWVEGGEETRGPSGEGLGAGSALNAARGSRRPGVGEG